MEYAQMMMSCGLLVCPADESDVAHAEKTKTLVTFSRHSRPCPYAQKRRQLKSEDSIKGIF